MGAQIGPKSEKYMKKGMPKMMLDFGTDKLARAHVIFNFGTFLGGPRREQGGSHPLSLGAFGDHFSSKIEKMASKKASKNRCRKSIEK